MNKEEAIKRIRQNISAAEFHMGLTQLRSTIENELLDIEAFKMAIEALSVDIVRCKECKYCYYADNRVPNEQGHVCDYYHFETEPNGYCHVGIRRKEKR